MNDRILFVEDESDLALIVADTLRQQGYEVATAADGVQGLERFRAEGADIVVADVMMPRMDGFAMAREIRKASPAAPLLFLTAKNTVDDVEKGFGIGADDYLKKPFELRELIVRIKALLRRLPQRRQHFQHRLIHIQRHHADPHLRRQGDTDVALRVAHTLHPRRRHGKDR